MDIIWLGSALDDLRSAQNYIAKENPSAAKWIVQKVVHAVQGLATHPHVGRPGRVVGTRELVIPDTPFIVPYQVMRDRLEILRVLHGAQLWPDQLD
ncbi:MAG: type II toxin-antitoxin system RelE/ParE family toxin [Magnetococcales bacterium]|nr:type II toxin-antitoxin system RelE/ParE family toxin [Magnetococcales bacterium]